MRLPSRIVDLSMPLDNETTCDHMEKLLNLEQLPATGFVVSCFPWKIKGASAGFVRAVAMFD